jgi:hypothetical protein
MGAPVPAESAGSNPPIRTGFLLSSLSVSDAGPAQYDTVELRRRIAGAFSAGELRALAGSLGVGGINWDRGVQEAAREVVRQCERYAGLPALISRLREERPYLEWPEPMAAAPAPADLPPVPDAATAIPPTNAYEAVPALAPTPGSLGPTPGNLGPPAVPALGPTPGSFGSAPAPPLSDPYAPAASAPPRPVPFTMGSPAGAPPPSPAGWPGVVGPAAPAARPGGIDPRIFIAVAGLMVVAAIIAYLAGRASTATADAASAPAASASAPPEAAPRSGPAALAAAVLSRSFANLARVCELPPSAGAGAYVFQQIAERCGPAAPPPHRASSPPPADTPADPPAPSANATPPPRNRRPGRDPAPAGGGAAPAPARGGCMGACEAQHAACRAHCGPEPVESSAYDGFARCQGQCLRDASRCRLNCR